MTTLKHVIKDCEKLSTITNTLQKLAHAFEITGNTAVSENLKVLADQVAMTHCDIEDGIQDFIDGELAELKEKLENHLYDPR